MDTPMQYTDTGKALTQGFEKCHLTPYQDSGGVWTDGWGNTHGVVPGQDITQEQADAQFLVNIQGSVDAVNASVTCDLTQNQFNACVDFAFNCGNHAFENSTLLKKLNEGDATSDVDAVLAEFAKWDKAGGVVLAGLDHRREGEEALFVAPDEA